MRALLEARFGPRNIEIHVTAYDHPWEDIMRTLLYGAGPDVSEVGSTWVRSLAGGNGLRSIGREILSADKLKLFVCPAWEENQTEVFSLPFQVETRVIFYRRAALNAAGIDEKTAFSTPRQFNQTMQALREYGFQPPLLLPIEDHSLDLSLAATWVWGAGADFISADGKQVLFDQEAALQGLADYFSLHQYLPANALEMTNPGWEFVQGGYPVTMDGPWVYYTWLEQQPRSTGREEIGIALPPGPTYQGGTNLVIWRQTRHPELAAELAQYLTSFEFQTQWKSGLLPARRDVLALPVYTQDPFLNRMVEATLQGRAYSNAPLWGVVEDRLSRVLREIWQECLRNPRRAPIDILRETLKPLAKRLNITLQN